MQKRDAAVLSSCLAIVVTAVLYVVNPPAPIYYPLEHTWSWQKLPGVPSMSWYGRSLWAIGSGVVTFLGAWLVTSRLASEKSDPARWLPAVVTWITLLGLAAALGDTVVHEYSTWIK